MHPIGLGCFDLSGTSWSGLELPAEAVAYPFADGHAIGQAHIGGVGDVEGNGAHAVEGEGLHPVDVKDVHFHPSLWFPAEAPEAGHEVVAEEAFEELHPLDHTGTGLVLFIIGRVERHPLEEAVVFRFFAKGQLVLVHAQVFDLEGPHLAVPVDAPVARSEHLLQCAHSLIDGKEGRIAPPHPVVHLWVTVVVAIVAPVVVEEFVFPSRHLNECPPPARDLERTDGVVEGEGEGFCFVGGVGCIVGHVR